jgi:hypothetical protein
MKIDRPMQLEFLNAMKERYPAMTSFGSLDLHKIQNLNYLAEHGLVESSRMSTLGANGSAQVKITAKGIDFLEGDGGLTAMLGVVDVRLHADSIKALMVARVEASALPAEQKSKLREQLNNLPGNALTHLTNKLVDLGLQNVPVAIQMIQHAISQATNS